MYPYIFIAVAIAAISSLYFKGFFEIHKYQNKYKNFLILACTLMVAILNTGLPFIAGFLLSISSKLNELLKIQISNGIAYFGTVLLYVGTIFAFAKVIYGFKDYGLKVEIAGNDAANYQVLETLETEPSLENELENPVDTSFNIDTIGLGETIDTRVEEMIFDEESLICQLHSIIVEEVIMIQLNIENESMEDLNYMQEIGATQEFTSNEELNPEEQLANSVENADIKAIQISGLIEVLKCIKGLKSIGIECLEEKEDKEEIESYIDKAFYLKSSGDLEGAITSYMYALEHNTEDQLTFWMVLDVCVLYKQLGKVELALDILQSYMNEYGNVMNEEVKLQIINNLQ